jgi:hypothetical protein
VPELLQDDVNDLFELENIPGDRYSAFPCTGEKTCSFSLRGPDESDENNISGAEIGKFQ